MKSTFRILFFARWEAEKDEDVYKRQVYDRAGYNYATYFFDGKDE